MEAKKKILFVQESLALAGGEKSLIALLSNLDPKMYDIDLQLFRYGGELDKLIPDYINILPPIPYTTFAAEPWTKNIKSIFKKKHLSFLKSKLTYSIRLRQGKFNHPEKSQLYWESIRSTIPIRTKVYDVAIAYAQGVPTFYVTDKVRAEMKVAWVNVNVKFKPRNKVFQRGYYERFDRIIPVSSVTYEHLNGLFPELTSKLYMIHDIIDYKSIEKMSMYEAVNFDRNKFNILTVARLNKHQKGYDISLEACNILRDRGVDFHWYAIGSGPYLSEMESYIKEHHLESHFTFLGTTPNPYPYFKAADLYVQTSRHEGYGLSIAEARLLNIPVVTTRFDTVFEQMVHEQNGLVTDMNGPAVADAIIRMMEDRDLYNHIVDYLTKEQKENLESVKRFDELVFGAANQGT